MDLDEALQILSEEISHNRLCDFVGMKRDINCSNPGTILIKSSCSNGCWGPKEFICCEPHSLEIRNDNNYLHCGRCDSQSVVIERMTSV